MHGSSEYPPGSIYAVEAGCKCPPHEQRKGYVWLEAACPLHGQIDADEYDDEERAGFSDTKEID